MSNEEEGRGNVECRTPNIECRREEEEVGKVKEEVFNPEFQRNEMDQRRTCPVARMSNVERPISNIEVGGD